MDYRYSIIALAFYLLPDGPDPDPADMGGKRLSLANIAAQLG